MICSSRSYEKFIKEGLSPNAAKWKATYAFVYLGDAIKKQRSRLSRDPGNEIYEDWLNMLMRNKAILLGANTDDKVHYICDKLCGDLFYTFNLGGK